MKRNFQVCVLQALTRIPPGKVTTYGEIARFIGAPNAARAVGQALHHNPDPLRFPCYKVVSAKGNLSPSFGDGGIAVQKERLIKDGIPVKDLKVDLTHCFFHFEKED